MKHHTLFALILAVLMLTACGGNSGTIKIGLVAPLTGDNAVWGDPVNKAAIMAVEEINAAGGINGKMLQLISEEGGCKGDVAVKSGNKLITVDRVIAIVGGGCSSETLAIAPIAEESNVVLFSPTSSNPSITDAGDYIFRSTPSDQLQGKVMAEHLIDVGLKSAAAIYANSDYNLGLKNAFQKRFEELGGKVVVAETYEQDSRDFRTQLTKIKFSSAAALYLIPYVEGGLIMKQARELGLPIPFFGSETTGDKKIITEAAGAAEGLVYATPKFDAKNSKSADFLVKYRAKYGTDPAFPNFATDSYDNVYLIAAGIKQNGETGEGIKNYLYTVKDYDGAGGMLTLDENGDPIKDFQLMMVKNGELVPYEEKAAKPAPVPAPTPAPPAAKPVVGASAVEEVEAPAPKPSTAPKYILSVKEWDVLPGETTVSPGQMVFQIANRGSNPHSVEVLDKGKNVLAETGVIEPGMTETLTLTLTPGNYEIRGQSEDEWQKGIRGLIIVE